jgi:hypothetical protein
MRNFVTALLSLLFLLAPGFAQTKPPAVGLSPAGNFPAELLEGMQQFSLALQFFADSRGNFGPCG